MQPAGHFPSLSLEKQYVETSVWEFYRERDQHHFFFVRYQE